MSLIYSFVLASGVQQSDSITHVCIFIFFSTVVYYRLLNLVSVLNTRTLSILFVNSLHLLHDGLLNIPAAKLLQRFLLRLSNTAQ